MFCGMFGKSTDQQLSDGMFENMNSFLVGKSGEKKVEIFQEGEATVFYTSGHKEFDGSEFLDKVKIMTEMVLFSKKPKPIWAFEYGDLYIGSFANKKSVGNDFILCESDVTKQVYFSTDLDVFTKYKNIGRFSVGKYIELGIMPKNEIWILSKEEEKLKVEKFKAKKIKESDPADWWKS